MGLPYDASMDIWSAGCIFYELIVGLPPFVTAGIRSDLEFLRKMKICFEFVAGKESSKDQSSASGGRETSKLPTASAKFVDEDAVFQEQFMATFRRSVRVLCEETAVFILTGCLSPNHHLRIGLDRLAVTGKQLLAKIPQRHKQIGDAKAQISGKHECGEDMEVGTDSNASETSQKKRPTETAGSHAPNSTEAGLATSAGPFNRSEYVKGGRTAEWRLIQEEGGARANAWQDLKVCRCHGQCGARSHRNRIMKPCQHEGTIKCKDIFHGFAFFFVSIVHASPARNSKATELIKACV